MTENIILPEERRQRITRSGEITRETLETRIFVKMTIEGTGTAVINTPIPFFTHMLKSLARQALFDLTVYAQGDIEVDQHHTVEDIGIVLGQALRLALGTKAGIERLGTAIIPMDEALVRVCMDLSGRGFCRINGSFRRRYCGGFDLDLLPDFFLGFAENAGLSLHMDVIEGRSDHHKVAAAFKAVGRALRWATAKNPQISGVILSTKGAL